MVQNMIFTPMASRNRRSARIAVQATAIVAATPPSDLAAGTCGTVQAAMNPTTARTVRVSPASQGLAWERPRKRPPAVVPPMMAKKVHIFSRPLPSESCSYESNSGRMPYLAGLKNALWTPIPPRTIKAGHPPAGFHQSATVPAPISATSPTFMAMMTVRLLNRSDRHAGNQGKQHERQVEDDEGDGGLCLGGCFERRARRPNGSRDLPDGQQGDHQFPGVVVERAEELRDQESAERMRRGAGPCNLVLETVHQERPRMVRSVPVFGVGGKCFLPLNLHESHNGLSSQSQPEQLHTSPLVGCIHSHQPPEEIPGGSPLRLMSVPVQWDDRVEFKD